MLTIRHLETDITQTCQLSCVACNHHVPLYRQKGPTHARPAQVEQDLNHLAGFLRAERWGAVGGEPLLAPALLDILRIAKASGVAVKTEVWTNGLRLPQMPPAFWQAFDVLILSVYEGKHDDASLAWIADACADHGVELTVKDERLRPNFRTLLEPAPTDAETTRQKFAQCFFRRFSRVANDGYFFTCCCSPHMPVLLQGKPFGTDGVAIEGLTETGLREFLNRTEPLGSCTLCAGRETATPVRWHEQRDPDRWVAESAGVA
jgi:hypothetical protein